MNQTFDLRDLIFTILRKWRIFVCLLLVGGILGAGFAFLKTRQPSDISALEARTELQQQCDAIEATIAQEEIRLKENVKFNFDPNIAATAKQMFYFTHKANGENACPLSNVYTSLLSDDSFLETLNDQLSVGAMRDLVTITPAGSMLTVTILQQDATDAEEAMRKIEQYLAKQYPQIQAQYHEHEFKALPMSIQTQFDATLQKWQQTTAAESKAKVESLKKQLTPLQEELNKEIVVFSKSLLMKWVLAGSVGGLGLALVLILFFDLMKNKMHGAREIEHAYQMKCLADLSIKEDK